MSKDQMFGIIILIAGIVCIVVYGWLMWAYPLVTLQITAFLAVAAILGIAAWIGWTMATTPPPKPIEPDVGPSTGSPETGGNTSAEKS